MATPSATTCTCTLNKLLSEEYVQFGDFWTIPYLFLGIKDCNANTFATFSTDVTLSLEILSKYSERTYLGTYLSEIYMEGLLKVLRKANGKYSDIVNQRQRKAVEVFLKYMKDLTEGRNHVQCLRKLQCFINDIQLEDEETIKHTESVIQDVFACHVFSPLVSEGKVVVDSKSYRSTGTSSSENPEPEAHCIFCKGLVNQGNNNFGCRDLWHGRADLVIRTEKSVHIVKVACDSKNMAEDEEYGEPSSKMTKSSSSSCSEDQLETHSFEEDFCTYLTTKAYKQVISQTMLNSFLDLKLHNGLGNLLVPSFLVCQNSIFINFYDAVNDILLVQSKPMHLFEGKNEVNIDAFFSLWMALNSTAFPSAICDFYKTAQKSGFKDLLNGFGVLHKYQREIESNLAGAQTEQSKKLPQKYAIDPDKKKLIGQFFMSLG